MFRVRGAEGWLVEQKGMRIWSRRWALLLKLRRGTELWLGSLLLCSVTVAGGGSLPDMVRPSGTPDVLK